ncbi:hypothetical protein ABH930_002990 [Kitasatospora sp. GAS204A]|uniref:hypothetical protein n=1 Tax=unclassified Kitasatospora TaxID=2633591 RepID=UPI002476BA81|nr:hypothetical protein [Kitasatospora sp. GAS204B]MDH6117649.1 hypothetical protein [Kitasatospora sp. GAS204B]
MTDTRGPGPLWSGEPMAATTAEPDWAALAETYQRSSQRRQQVRKVAACVAAAAAVGGIVVTAVEVTGSGQKPGHSSALAGVGPSGIAGWRDTTASATDSGNSASPSASSSTGPGAPASAGASATPDAPASTGASVRPGAPSSTAPRPSTATQPADPIGSTSHPAAPAPGGSAGSTAPTAPAAPAQTPGAGPTAKGSPTPTPPAAANPYSPGQVCGTGYGVIDSHSLGDATVYLLYNNATGVDCAVTLAAHPSGAVPMNATLAVQGGASTSNPGNFVDYAGPVTEHAPHICVSWGGSYRGTSWTSGWSHCG